MAAYSAVASFRQVLEQLLNSDQFPLDYKESQIKPLHKNVSSLQTSLDKIPFVTKKWRSRVNELQTKIRDAIYTAQDIIESSISKSLSSEYSDQSSTSGISLEDITTKIDDIAKEAEKIADEIKGDPATGNLLPDDDQSKSSSSGKRSKIVGQEQDRAQITDRLLQEDKQLQVIPITGLPGIGKTTLARSIYDHKNMKDKFNIRAWVTVSQEYSFGEIFSKLLGTMESKNYQAGHYAKQGSEEQLSDDVYHNLYNQRYLIVVDDIWDLNAWDKIRIKLPHQENGSRVVLTTRVESVAKDLQSSFHKMQPLNMEHSWELLCDRAFGDDPCPNHLKETGMKIAKNCRGLPLSLVVVGGLLFQQREKIEYWKSIEEDTNDAAAKGEDSYLEILSLSYNHLPGNLKGCFLYMGAFPEDSEVPVSKLVKLWVAEGFLTPPHSPSRTVEYVAHFSLDKLIERNLISSRKNGSDGQMKACGVHDSLRELAEKECKKEKFFHARKKYNQKLEEGSDERQRRVSVHRNILMCLEQVYESTKLIKDARSLLYVGPHHHHPLPFRLTFNLLRVLDAYTVYFIEFPHEFVKLIHLRYLSLTYNGKISSSLSKLHKLQILIVRRQPKIIFVGASYLPDEIWNMPQLRHLLFTESDLPVLPLGQNSPLLANLQSLTNVNATTCTEEVLRNMPNLKKLGMWVEAPGVVGLHLDKLNQLEVFKFTVLNPIPGKMVDFQPKPLFFPERVRKLSLSGCGLPWEDMKVIAELKFLEVLKLRELAFHGGVWCPDYIFPKLKFLLIEYLNFKKWETDNSQYPRLERLKVRHCYELEGIPSKIGELGYLELIEMVDCSPDAVESAEYIKEQQEQFGNKRLQVNIFSSWE